MKLIRALSWSLSGPSPSAQWFSVWPKWNINHWIFCPRTLQAERDFSGSSHQYRSHFDTISIKLWYIVVSSKGTAAAKWEMKISRYLCQYCRYWLQNFTVTLFQLYANLLRMTSMHCFSDACASHTAKSLLQKYATGIPFCQTFWN